MNAFTQSNIASEHENIKLQPVLDNKLTRKFKAFKPIQLIINNKSNNDKLNNISVDKFHFCLFELILISTDLIKIY